MKMVAKVMYIIDPSRLERIAERKHEARNARRNAKPVQGRQRSRIGGLRRRRRECEQHRLAYVTHQEARPGSDDQVATLISKAST